ncbi:hypothetical protein MY4824_008195 [Beauveria thailandica]
MSDDVEATDEAGSDACSESSKCNIECKERCQSCSADSSEAGSLSNQDPSDSPSGSEECLARKVCLKRTLRKCSNSSGSSEEQSSACSVSSASSESAKCHSESKDHVPEPTSGSEDTESSITKSSTAAAQSEESSQSNKTSSGDKNGPEATSTKDKSGWSLSEDSLLRSMKEADDGLSWEEIGKSLNRGKNECKSRWKVIKNHQPAQEALPEDGLDGDDAKQDQKAPSPTEADDEKTAKVSTPNQQVVEASADAEVVAARQPRDDDDDLMSEHERQKRYWHRHIGRHLYPASVRIEPDAHFSQSDCRVLEMIDARHGSVRWLEAQARFYNETGRMVPLDVIRRKCEDGAAVRTEADIDGWLEGISDGCCCCCCCHGTET